MTNEDLIRNQINEVDAHINEIIINMNKTIESLNSLNENLKRFSAQIDYIKYMIREK